MASADLSATGIRRQQQGTRAVLLVMCASVMVAQSLVAAINLAIPKLSASGLNASPTELLWIVDAYVIVFAGLLIPAGALGDRFGRKGVLLTGLGLFGTGSAVCALAPSVAPLLTGRALCGAGAALLMPASMSLLLHSTPGERRATAVATWSASLAVGGVLGNTAGALILQYLPWQALFWAYVPFAVALLCWAGRIAPRPERSATRLDLPGSLLLILGCTALLFGVIEGPSHGWGSLPVLTGFSAAVLVLVVFVVHESRTAHPVLDPWLLRLRPVRSGTIGVAALFFGMFALFYVNAQFLQYVEGFSPLQAGLGVLPVAVGIMVVTRLSPLCSDRLGALPTVTIGLLLVIAGLMLMSTATAATPYALYALYLLLMALGNGVATPVLSHAVVSGLPPQRLGVGSGLNSAAREFGSALGIAVVGTALASGFSDRLPSAVAVHGDAPAHAFAAAARLGSDSQAAVVAAFTHAVATGYRVAAAALLAMTLVVVMGMRRRPADRSPKPKSRRSQGSSHPADQEPSAAPSSPPASAL
ncbi:MFS transporter [Streptomyces sp. NPDC057623]|uniref:MFS transporter n=1 Tax=Streptomyces sp. NPDC057623 TaxID=3346187 RepID=UPI0036BF3834